MNSGDLLDAGRSGTGRRRASGRLTSALPSLREALVGSLLWASATTACAIFALGRVNAWIDGHIGALALVYFAGSALAFPPAVFVMRLLAARRRGDTRFAAAFVCLTVATIGITSLIYALQHLRYDVGWGDLTAGPVSVLYVAFSIVAAQAEFAALGVRLYAPEGLLPLVAASLWLAQARR